MGTMTESAIDFSTAATLSSSKRSARRDARRSASNAKRGMHAREGLDVNTSLTRRRRRQSERTVAATVVAAASVLTSQSASPRLAVVRLFVFSSHGISITRDETTQRRGVRARRVRPGSHLLPCADGSTEIKGIRTRTQHGSGLRPADTLALGGSDGAYVRTEHPRGVRRICQRGSRKIFGFFLPGTGSATAKRILQLRISRPHATRAAYG